MHLKINQILYMQLNSIDDEEAKQEYKSRISDIQENVIAMEIPMNEKTGHLKRLYAGDELSVYFLTEGGMKNYFTTTVLGFREDVIRTVLIRKPEPEAVTKVQRRDFLRVPADLEVAVKLREQIQFLALTDDVSGGGISIMCDANVPVKTGDVLGCWLLVPFKNGKAEHVPFKADVVRANVLETGKLKLMLRFSDIADRDRQKVIRFCFERQLEFRKS